MPTQIVSRRQLASHIQVTTRTIAAWERAGLPSLRGAGRLRRYDLGAVLAWMEDRAKRALVERAA